MLGYNVSKINELLQDLGEKYDLIGGFISNQWPQVTSILQNEWVGPDEVSYEDRLSNRIITLYNDTESNIKIFNENIQNMGESWRTFQASNVIEGAVSNASAVGTITPSEIHRNSQIDEILKVDINKTFDSSWELGLKNGTQSATTLMDAVKTFVTRIAENTKEIYDAIDASKAFLGGEQAAQIKKYTDKFALQISNLLSSVNDLKECLSGLVANYEKQQQQVTQAADESKINIDSSNIIQ